MFPTDSGSTIPKKARRTTFMLVDGVLAAYQMTEPPQFVVPDVFESPSVAEAEPSSKSDIFVYQPVHYSAGYNAAAIK
ncbi:hypothetical protein T265_04828 [Opisthorchis viverrini]|uniref:Uncharacterized protein n=1 Tax=Opisthorchis viverrini TaxID=6198 RepID=A0A074ZYB1_OPIVI|nr:hypothetical protein T265_04828 [Opisthorchis viverrini]KER28295.1 hypothetical protein T265_04828 [Opisthorchis viverrini]